MTIQVTSTERDRLQKLVSRPARPTSRQKALALLTLAEGGTLEQAATRAGISEDKVSDLVTDFTERGLAGVGLLRPQTPAWEQSRSFQHGRIEKTPGVCGGAARIAGTRIPVWQLVEARELGASEAQLLIDFPGLKAINLVDAWEYAEAHPKEIDAEIHKNEVV